MDNHLQQSASHKPGHRFPQAVSGNPERRPKASRNRKNAPFAQPLLDSRAEARVRKAVQLALEGDFNCLRFCPQRLIARKNDAPLDFSLAALRNASDIRKLFSSIAASLDSGGITPCEARVLIDMSEASGKRLDLNKGVGPGK